MKSIGCFPLSMNKIFSFLIVFIPIFSVYKSPLPGVDFSTFCAIIFSFFYIIFCKKIQISINIPFVFLIFYIIFFSLWLPIFTTDKEIMLHLLRAFKFSYLIIFIFFICYKQLFDVNYSIKILNTLTLFLVLYIFIQKISFSLFGYTLPSGFISLINSDNYIDLDYEKIYENFYRPSSFFIEPAYFSHYVLLGITYNIFGYNYGKLLYNYKYAVIFSIGIFISGSGQGILLTVLIWSIWLIKNLLSKKSHFKFVSNKYILIFFIIFISVPVGYFTMKTELVTMSLDRVFTSNIDFGGNAVLARMMGYEYFFNLPIIYKIIGVGFGNVPSDVYFSSLSYILYTIGFLGFLIILYIFIRAFYLGDIFQKVFLIVYFILIIGSNTFTATQVCFYFSFIYIDKKF